VVGDALNIDAWRVPCIFATMASASQKRFSRHAAVSVTDEIKLNLFLTANNLGVSSGKFRKREAQLFLSELCT
jgi:hypothetical protein